MASHQEGSWDGTEEHARVGLKAAKGRPHSMVHVAPLLLLAGKQEEYHELCEALLANEQDWKDETLVAVSILCTLDPKTPDDPAKFKHLVQRAG